MQNIILKNLMKNYFVKNITKKENTWEMMVVVRFVNPFDDSYRSDYSDLQFSQIMLVIVPIITGLILLKLFEVGLIP